MAALVEPTAVRCSFCAKESTDVQKVIAGPGVYICNECVELCQLVLEQEAQEQRAALAQPQLPAWDAMSDEQILAHVPRIAAVMAQVEHSLQQWVGQLRERGITWERIGTALGVTRQSAWERFGKTV